jgi:hypothetical protein
MLWGAALWFHWTVVWFWLLYGVTMAFRWLTDLRSKPALEQPMTTAAADGQRAAGAP